VTRCVGIAGAGTMGAGIARRGGDPRAHRPGPGDPEAKRHASALMPVSARPMISFWICDVPSYSVVTRTSRK
jgi:hypothetical protein